MSRRGWALFAVVGVIWGPPYQLIKIADGGVSVPVLVFARVATGTLLLPVVLRGGRLRALRPYLNWLVGGLGAGHPCTAAPSAGTDQRGTGITSVARAA
jgi:drug/metabolite transporter (DMT)-like permease